MATLQFRLLFLSFTCFLIGVGLVVFDPLVYWDIQVVPKVMIVGVGVSVFIQCNSRKAHHLPSEYGDSSHLTEKWSMSTARSVRCGSSVNNYSSPVSTVLLWCRVCQTADRVNTQTLCVHCSDLCGNVNVIHNNEAMNKWLRKQFLSLARKVMSRPVLYEWELVPCHGEDPGLMWIWWRTFVPRETAYKICVIN